MRNSSIVFLAVPVLVIAAFIVRRAKHHARALPSSTVVSVAEAEAPDPVGALKITTTDGTVDLVLAGDSVVYMKLADSLVHSVQRKMDEKGDTGSGLGASIANMVKTNVAKGLARARVKHPLTDISTARYENGAIVFTGRNNHDLSFDGIKVSDKPALQAFAPADAERFVAAVNAAKRKSGR